MNGITAAVPERCTAAIINLGFAGVGFMTYRRNNNRTVFCLTRPTANTETTSDGLFVLERLSALPFPSSTANQSLKRPIAPATRRAHQSSEWFPAKRSRVQSRTALSAGLAPYCYRYSASMAICKRSTLSIVGKVWLCRSGRTPCPEVTLSQELP